jgi:hypothetical protein
LGPGFKYHIVSISAIFFALTIGLVVGSVFVSPQFVNRQEQIIRHLQDSLNNDIEEKRKEIAQKTECIETISPLALKDQLANATIAIIQTGDYPEVAARASEAIALANPRTVVHLELTPALDKNRDELDGTLARLHAATAILPADRDGLFQAISSLLAKGDSLTAPVLPQLEREGFLKLSLDDNFRQHVSLAVIVAGSRSTDSVRASRVDVPLIRALLKQGIRVVACEGKDATATDMPAIRVIRDEVSTVDNVDTDVGRCSLVLAFSSVHGDYGVKPGASRVMPPLPATP